MSKKKIYNKRLEKGRFYVHNDKHGGFFIRKEIKTICILLLSSHLLLALNEQS